MFARRRGVAPDLVAIGLREAESARWDQVRDYGDGRRRGDEILRNGARESDASDSVACIFGIFGKPKSAIRTRGD